MTGYSIIELLAVGAIVGILSVIVIVGQTAFNKTLLLANTASDIALSLHNTQLFGIGSRTVSTEKNAGYGLDFSYSTPSSYIFFADTNPAPGGANACRAVPSQGAGAPNAIPGNCYYTSADTIVQTYTLNNGMTISNFCAIIPTALPPKFYCKTGGTNAVEHVSIVFSRPNTQVTFGAGQINSGATSVVGEGTFSKACLTVSSPHGTTRSIAVTQIGHITATSTCP